MHKKTTLLTQSADIRKETLLSDKRAHGFDGIGLASRLVPSDPADTRKAKRNSGFVPRAVMGTVKGKLDDKLLFDLAHGSKAVGGMGPHPFVEFAKLVAGLWGAVLK